MPKISILVPVYNGLPYIPETVDSVMRQEEQDWELVISDNGSKDGTRAYLKTLTDPRIRIFEQEADLGCYGNLSFLFQQARAPLSPILCADDYFMDAGGLGKILAFWEKQPAELGFMRCNWGFTMGEFRLIGSLRFKVFLQKFQIKALPARVRPEDSDLYFFLFGSIPGSLSNVSMRTRVVADCGGFDQKLYPYAGDFDFFSRAGRRTGFAVVPELWVYIRIHPGAGGLVANKKGESVRQVFALVQGLYDRLKGSYPGFLLKLNATASYDSIHRNSGVMNKFRHGSPEYLAQVNHWSAGANCFFGPAGRWLIFLLTAGGKFGRVTFSRWLLHYKKN